GTRINAHRVVLAASSNYFEAMFTNKMAGSRVQEIEMVDIEASTLEALVNFCYSGKVKINEINVFGILLAADLFLMDKVKNVIGTKEFQHLSTDELVELLSGEEISMKLEEQ
ncbi:BTB/POZ domain protein, partial [Teladorsagia circumcincta]